MKPLRPPLKSLYPLLIISMLAIVSYAIAVSTTTSTLASDNGIYFNLTGAFSAVSNGFGVVTGTAAASGQPCTWTSGGTCQTALTGGDWDYSVTLTINAGAAASTTYTTMVQWNTGTGYSALGSLTVTTPATITTGQTMTFLFDLGGTSFTAPTAITTTVA